MVSPASCLACHQLGSQPFTTCRVKLSIGFYWITKENAWFNFLPCRMWSCSPEECPRTWKAARSQDKAAASLLQGRNQIVLVHTTEKWLKINLFLDSLTAIVKVTNLSWYQSGFALNRPWSDSSLKIIVNAIYSKYMSLIISVKVSLNVRYFYIGGNIC